MRSHIIVCLLWTIILSSMAHAQAPLINTSYNQDKKTKAKLTALFSRLPTSGYVPLRLEIKNAQKTERTWSIKCTSTADNNSYSAEKQSVLSEFKYSCPAGDTKTFDILVPVATGIHQSSHPEISSNLDIQLTSSGSTEYRSLNSAQIYNLPATLLSSDLHVAHSSRLDSTLPSGSYTYNAQYASSINPSAMPSDWKAYIGYDALVCTDKDWLAMSKAAQNSILEWNRLGSTLVILRLNSSSNFKTLDIESDTTKSAKKTLNRSSGKVKIVDIISIGTNKVSDIIKKNVETRISNRPKQEHLTNLFNKGSWDLQNSLGKLSFNPTLLILILILFGVLVGPVNLFVFAKSGKRHKLFITTPIIALGTSLLLILIIIFQDGFGGHGHRIQLMEVRADGTENKAYIKQEQIARTGVVLNGSFETSSPTYITPVPLEESRYSRVTAENSGGNATYIAEHGENGLSASGDWFQSRSEHGHYLESIIPTRGRITIKNSSSAPTLNSSFDFKIDTILYCDNDRQYWLAKELNSGESITLSKISEADARKLVIEQMDKSTKLISHHLEKFAKRNNHFLALSSDAPAIETLDSINWQKTTTFITGPVVK